MIRLISAAITVALLAGCSLTGGKERFTCPDHKDGVCASARDVYRATDAPRVTGLRIEDGAVVARVDGGAGTPQASQPRRTALPAETGTIMAATPVVVPARSMRIWFAPFEDRAGNLYAGGFVWTEMSGRRWAYGTNVGDTGPRNVYPLQVEPRAETNRSAATPVVSQDRRSGAPRLPADRAVGGQ